MISVPLVLAGALASLGREVYVAADGRDDNPGTREQPLRSLGRAAAILAPGDVCRVAGGTYRETLRPVRSGSFGQPIRFEACAGETASLQGSIDLRGRAHIEIFSLTVVDGQARLDSAVHCRLQNCHFRRDVGDAPESGTAVVVLGGRHNVLVGCWILNALRSGVHLLPDSANNEVVECLLQGCGQAGPEWPALQAAGTAHLIRRVTVERAAGPALEAHGLMNARVEFCDFRLCGGAASNVPTVRLRGNGKGTVVAYNWIHDNASPGGLGVQFVRGLENYIVRNNVVWGHAGIGLLVEPAVRGLHLLHNTAILNGVSMDASGEGDFSGVRVVNNVLAGRGWVTVGGRPPPGVEYRHNFDGTNPGLTDPAQGDFMPRPNSPCVDAGLRIPEFAEEPSGGVPDLGAYERGRERWVPGCSASASRGL